IRHNSRDRGGGSHPDPCRGRTRPPLLKVSGNTAPPTRPRLILGISISPGSSELDVGYWCLNRGQTAKTVEVIRKMGNYESSLPPTVYRALVRITTCIHQSASGEFAPNRAKPPLLSEICRRLHRGFPHPEENTMKRTLVVYYSRTGITGRIANEIAGALDCEIEEIQGVRPCAAAMGFLRSAFR